MQNISKQIMTDPRDVCSLVELFAKQSDIMGKSPFMWQRLKGEWHTISWLHSQHTIARMANSLRMMGVKKGARVLLLSENRPEWIIANIAIMALGAISVPLYTTQTPDAYSLLIKDSGARYAFCSNATLYDKLYQALQKSDAYQTFAGLIMMEPIEESFKKNNAPPLYEWDDCLKTGEMRATNLMSLCQSLKRDQICSIIYSSGTTGDPNGVMLTHGSILCNCYGALRVLDHLENTEFGREVFLSFLPLSHSYEHFAGQFLPILIGAQIYFCDHLERLIDDITEVRPTLMSAVPRLYEMLQKRIMQGLKTASPLRRRLFSMTLKLGQKRIEGQPLSLIETILDILAEKLVRKKIKAKFGSRLKTFISGGAPLNYENGLFLSSIGLQLLQGYGLTETSPVVSVNNPKCNRLDTVGRAMEGVEVKCASDGEILIRGELVMQGYWNKPELTAKTIRQGWLMSGDIGKIDEDGFIKIIDRKKDIIVNSGGENISPQKIEGMLCLNEAIVAAMVYGDQKAHLSALIVLDKGYQQDDAKIAIEKTNANLSQVERIRYFCFADEPFTIENGELTPSLKIRRHAIKKRYSKRLEALYPKPS
ncbi:MAG: long-chain fatty acid--CoA ligase [Pseudomonadota bacterium]